MLKKKFLDKAMLVYGVGILSILVASCDKPADEAGLSLLEWNGFQHPQYYPEYLEKYGEAPAFTFFAHTNDALKRMRSGLKVDLAHLCTGQMQEARDEGLIVPIDTSRLPRWGEVSPELLELPDVRIDGEYWLVPWEWGYSTVGYNPELMDVDSPSFDIFIDPRFKGMTALPSDTEVNLWIAGVIGGWADPMDPTEEEMQAAPEIFRKMLENARFVWTDSTQLEQAWAAGDVGISYIYGSASRRMVEGGPARGHNRTVADVDVRPVPQHHRTRFARPGIRLHRRHDGSRERCGALRRLRIRARQRRFGEFHRCRPCRGDRH